MKLIFIGSGSAFSLTNYQSNMVLISDQDTKLLIDCGTDTRFALNSLGISYADIGHIYISHLHSDHVGGLEWLGFTRKFDPQCSKPHLYISRFIKNELWNNVLSGGMRSLQGEVTDLYSYFTVHSIPHNGSFVWEGVEFQLIQTIHIMDGFSIVPSFGLLFTINGIKTFLTTDTQFSPEQIKDFYNKADVIFHDCETATNESGVHAHYTKLRTLPEHQKNKMWLYHYQDGELPDAKADGFLGFVKQGQVFDFDHPDSIFGRAILGTEKP
jgi:ribonuclease BN (tRNA processing enzyme)